MLYGVITLGSGYILFMLCCTVCVTIKCVKCLKLRCRQYRNQRDLERRENPLTIQMSLLPRTVENLSV